MYRCRGELDVGRQGWIQDLSKGSPDVGKNYDCGILAFGMQAIVIIQGTFIVGIPDIYGIAALYQSIFFSWIAQIL